MGAPISITCDGQIVCLDYLQAIYEIEFIADVIADTIRRDVASSINHIADVVRTKFSMVIPKYNKLWRGREFAIARLFGSWEGSYSLLEPIL